MLEDWRRSQYEEPAVVVVMACLSVGGGTNTLATAPVLVPWLALLVVPETTASRLSGSSPAGNVDRRT